MRKWTRRENGCQVLIPCCRNCKFYRLADVQGKNGRIVPDRVAKCDWTLPEGWEWPASMRFHHKPRLSASHMSPDEGTDCGTYQERTEDQPNA